MGALAYVVSRDDQRGGTYHSLCPWYHSIGDEVFAVSETGGTGTSCLFSQRHVTLGVMENVPQPVPEPDGLCPDPDLNHGHEERP